MAWKFWKSKPKIRISEFKDLHQLDRLTYLATSLKSFLPINHPGRAISNKLKTNLDSLTITNLKPIQILDKISQELEYTIKEIESQFQKFDDSETLKPEFEIGMRIILLQEYFKSLKNASQQKEISLQVSRLPSLVDAYILGSSKDRIFVHLSLYPESFSPNSLQDCFYRLFDPEIETSKRIFSLVDGIHPDTKKEFPNYTKTYLLDVFELNSKARCVFAWSDSKHQRHGFKTLEETERISHLDVVKGRENFFPEATEVLTQIMMDFTQERKKKYDSKRNFRSTIRSGAIFVFLTCLVDWYVCTM